MFYTLVCLTTYLKVSRRSAQLVSSQIQIWPHLLYTSVHIWYRVETLTRLRNNETPESTLYVCPVYRSLRSSRQRWRWTSPAVTSTCSPVSWMRTSAHGSAWFKRRIPRTSFGISPSAQTQRWKHSIPAFGAFQDFKSLTCIFIKRSFFDEWRRSFVFYSCLLAE